jgi:hypothetical protein
MTPAWTSTVPQIEQPLAHRFTRWRERMVDQGDDRLRALHGRLDDVPSGHLLLVGQWKGIAWHDGKSQSFADHGAQELRVVDFVAHVEHAVLRKSRPLHQLSHVVVPVRRHQWPVADVAKRNGGCAPLQELAMTEEAEALLEDRDSLQSGELEGCGQQRQFHPPRLHQRLGLARDARAELQLDLRHALLQELEQWDRKQRRHRAHDAKVEASRTSSRRRSIWRRMAAARSRSRCPSTVSWTPRAWRLSRETPSSSSIAARWWLSAGWAMCSVLAAVVMLPVRAISTKYLSCLGVMRTLYSGGDTRAWTARSAGSSGCLGGPWRRRSV